MRTLVLALLLVSAHAWAAHVTDKLVVGFYAKPDTKQRPAKLLPSGTPLEVLKNGDALTKVRLGDGQEGWVETSYVTDNKPAAAMLLEAQARIAELERITSPTAGSCPEAKPQSAIAPETDLKDQVAALTRERDACSSALKNHEARIAEVRKVLAIEPRNAAHVREPIDVDDWWQRYGIWVVPAVTLLVGFAAGVGFIDRRIRKRYGGLGV